MHTVCVLGSVVLALQLLSPANMSRRQQLLQRKASIMQEYQRAPGDTGSPEVQSEYRQHTHQAQLWILLWLYTCTACLSSCQSCPCHLALLLGPTAPGLRSVIGSVPLPSVALCVSVAVLTERIRDMTDHIVAHKKDHVSKRCVGRGAAVDLRSVCLMQPTRHLFRQPSTL